MSPRTIERILEGLRMAAGLVVFFYSLGVIYLLLAMLTPEVGP